ncbi:hypothetical protein ACFV1N_20575 [Streptosporangium canum]|uniref:hypothetical protein n=1 Tax=Streptosporangium canum TaxID=324952 RepID=UPI00369E8A09
MVRTVNEAEGTFFGDIAMNAIDWALDEGILTRLVERRTSHTRPAGGRFPGRRIARSKAEEGTSRVPLPVQFSPEQRQVLTEIMNDVGSRHMSTVIGAALEHFLADDQDEAGDL